jgi:hypothetical protein
MQMRGTAFGDPGGDRSGRRPSALFICGSLNQTRMMHAIARALPECEARFSTYYCDGALERLRRVGLLDFTILGWPWRKQSMRYLRQHGLPMDHEGRRNDYDLVITCSDVIMPRNILDKRVVVVQEGITDPERFWFWARKLLPFVPRWAAGTAWTGASNLYDRFCVASEGYRDLFVRKGADAARIVVTGIPNFDDCARYRNNSFPHRDYALCCTSDTRETYKFDNRKKFIRRAREIAGGRPLFFKLHPNENRARSTREIERWAPGARVFASGSAEEMVANASVLICQYSTLAFVGLALGKEVHSYYDLAELQRLLPLQGGGGARNIAEVCRGLLRDVPDPRRVPAAVPLHGPAAQPAMRGS